MLSDARWTRLFRGVDGDALPAWAFGLSADQCRAVIGGLHVVSATAPSSPSNGNKAMALASPRLRDDVLRGEDWFKARDFPYIFFRSQKLLFTDDKLSAVEGVLVMLGESRPMRLDVSRFKCGLNLASRQRGCGADAVGVLRRSEFGLSNGLPFIGDEVRLRIQVEAYLP